MSFHEFLANYKRTTTSQIQNIEFSLCGPRVIMCEEKERSRIFNERKLDPHKDDIEKYANDPELMIKVGTEYYDAKSFSYMLPYLQDKKLETPVSFLYSL